MKNNKKLAKILVILLSVALVIGALAMIVSAEDDIGYDLAESLNAATEGKVTLTGNAYVNGYAVTKDLEIDLNGYTLTSTAASAFTVDAAVNFTILGEGEINLAGMLVSSTTTEADFTVNVLGQTYTVAEGTGEKTYSYTDGIVITHTGTVDTRITTTNQGTWNFKNLDVTSTINKEGVQFGGFFETTADTNIKGAALNFELVTFVADGVHPKNPGQAVVTVAGTEGKLTMVDTYFRTTSTGIITGSSNVATNDTVVVEMLRSSVLVNQSSVKQRTAGILLNPQGAWDDQTCHAKGIININDSVVQGSYRLFIAGHDTANGIWTVNANNSYLQVTGINEGGDFARGKKLVLNVTGNSFMTSRSNSLSINGSVFTIGEGVRCGFKADLKTYPNEAGTFVLAYDPIGNKDYPYVVVKTHDADGNVLVADPNTVSVGANGYLYTTGYEDVAHNYTAATNYNLAYENKSGLTGTLSASSELGIKKGTLQEINANGDTYIKYWISPYNTPTDSYKGDVTRKFSTEKTIDGAQDDPFFILGGTNKADAAINKAKYASAANGVERAVVAVFEYDFTTDSMIGYPEMNIQFNTRNMSNSGVGQTSKIDVHNDGSISFGGNVAPNAPTQLKPFGEWNHITAVCYTDPGEQYGRVYYYINGEYLGNATIYKTNVCYLEGIRTNIYNNKDHKVGASIVFDNLVVRSYREYLGATEADGTVVDGVYTPGTHTPEAYLIDALTAPKTNFVLGNFQVGNLFFDRLNDAAAYADANNLPINMRRDVTIPQLVTVNAVVNTNGYTLNVADGSYGADTVFNANGEAAQTIFDAAYNEMFVEYWWYVGGDDGNMFSDDDYTKVQVKVGQTPGYENVNPSRFDLTAGTMQRQIGWYATGDGLVPDTFVPVTVKQVLANQQLPEDERMIRLYPVYGEYETLTAYVTHNGVPSVGCVNDTETNEAFVNLKNGDTLVLLADLEFTQTGHRFSYQDVTVFDGTNKPVAVNGVALDNDYTEDDLAKMKQAAAVIGIDLNGHTVNILRSGNFIGASHNVVVNVYSSQPGAEIFNRWKKTASNGSLMVSGNPVFVFSNKTDESAAESLLCYNAYINVGTFGEIPGSNLTVKSGVLFEGKEGDNSTFMYVDGVTAIRAFSDSTGGVMTRFFNGSMYFTNCKFFSSSAQLIDMKGYWYTDANGDGKNDNEGKFSNTRVSGCEDIEFTPYVSFENCVLLTYCTKQLEDGSWVYNQGNLVGNNGDGHGINLHFKNVVTNTRLNPSNEGSRTLAEEGVIAYIMDLEVAEGVVKGKYNAGYDVDVFNDFGFYAMQNPIIVDGAVFEDNYVYYVKSVDDMVYVPNGAKVVLLPTIYTEATAKAENSVTVTFKGLGQNEDVTVVYIKGGNVQPITLRSYTDGVFTYTHTGFESLPTNVQEDTTVVPTYDVTVNPTGLLANLSLYTDFGINLYIPAAYENMLTAVKNGETVLDTVKVTVNDVEYIKATINMAADKAAENAVFTLVFGESTVDVNVSVAEYASKILAGENFTAEEKKLAYNMVNYANEAAKYFSTTEAEALTTLLTTYADLADTEENVYNVITDSALGQVLDSITVSLGKNPAYVLTLKAGFAGTVKVAYADVVRTYTVTAENRREIIVSGMKIYNFAHDVKITANGTIDGNAVTTEAATFNLDTFVKYHIDNAANAESATAAESQACLAVLVAFYDYAVAADTFRGPVTAPEQPKPEEPEEPVEPEEPKPEEPVVDEFAVEELKQVANPVEGTAYKLFLYQATLKKTLVFNGQMNASQNYYADTSDDLTLAVDVYIENADGGFYIYFLNADGTKTYLESFISVSGTKTYKNMRLVTTTPETVYTMDETYGVPVVELDGEKYFLGNYNTYVTIAPSAYTHIASNNLLMFGQYGYTSAEDQVAAEKGNVKLDKTNVTAAGEATLPTAGVKYTGVAITWTSDSELAVVAGDKVTYTLPEAGAENVTVTLTATLTRGTVTETLTFTVTLVAPALPNPDAPAGEVKELATFDFGANGDAAHKDNNTAYAQDETFTEGNYTLTLTAMSKVYGSCLDAKGNSCLKLGTSSVVGTFTFTVPENVTEVVIYVAKYKANNTKININGTDYTLTKNSNDGEYDEIVVDTTTTKTVTFATVTGGVRCMINTIVYKGTEQ